MANKCRNVKKNVFYIVFGKLYSSFHIYNIEKYHGNYFFILKRCSPSTPSATSMVLMNIGWLLRDVTGIFFYLIIIFAFFVVLVPTIQGQGHDHSDFDAISWYNLRYTFRLLGSYVSASS